MSLAVHALVVLFVLLGVALSFAIHILFDAGNPMRVPVGGVLRRNWILCVVTVTVKWLIATAAILVLFVGWRISGRFGPDHTITALCFAGLLAGCFPDLAVLAILSVWRRRIKKLNASTRFDKTVNSLSEKFISRLTVEINLEARRRMLVIYETYGPEIINKAWEHVLPSILAATNRPHLRRIRNHAQKVNTGAIELGFAALEEELVRARTAHHAFLLTGTHPPPYSELRTWDGSEHRHKEITGVRHGPRRCDSYLPLTV